MDMQSKRIALDKIYKRRDRYEIPDWQRKGVWNDSQKKRLIDSVLRGWKLPKFYFQKTGSDPETFEVVDGQQRLTAIWGFYDGVLELSEESVEAFGAKSYKDLADSLSDAFDDYEIEYDVIADATEKEVKEFFQRLQAGLPLTSSEKLNSIHSKLRDYCVELSEHPFFKTSTVVLDRRHAYFDICSKVLVLEIEGLDSGIRFDDVSAAFLSNTAFSHSSAIARRVKSALDLLVEVFPEKSAVLKQRSMIQSIITLVCHLQEAGMADDQVPTLKEFIERFSGELARQVELGAAATDYDYMAFQRTVNANTKSGVRQRHEVLLRKLFAAHPDFFSVVNRSSGLEEALRTDVQRCAKEIRTTVQTVNERYAAKHGEDLFKATNKTAATLSSLDERISSLDEYKAWVDKLYFVFRESVGQRLNDQVPQSFLDVNNLRTYLQHDVDHGKGVAAKRKKLGETFAKYAGDSIPEGYDFGFSSSLQANLLNALVADLRSLAKSPV
ncbi:DUF262 domain-containing protein [Saccharothrix obliqua]|uniref:DUF262 domain-containing protein n=1 Tax=Saccharothrix obliqua TaxID=2861747 RepID=UPI001C5D35E8|nr:DUF262 domain-containing protein [Saccharothrix obliqua]MBW4721308.1 DUF262 domain-containing protein [Saccharothrix obliqua]